MIPTLVKLAELEEWRNAKRRICWRVRWNHATIGNTHSDHVTKHKACTLVRILKMVKGADPKLYKVTIKPKVKRCPK